MSDPTTMPKTLFIIEDDVDQATHIGHADVRELIVETNKRITVGTYRLVQTDVYELRDCYRLMKNPKPREEDDP